MFVFSLLFYIMGFVLSKPFKVCNLIVNEVFITPFVDFSIIPNVCCEGKGIKLIYLSRTSELFCL